MSTTEKVENWEKAYLRAESILNIVGREGMTETTRTIIAEMLYNIAKSERSGK